MKKIYEVLLIVFLCLALCLTMTSCFGEDDTTTAETPTTEAPTTEAPTTEAPTTEAPTTYPPYWEDPYYTEQPTTAPDICEEHLVATMPAVAATCYSNGLTEGKFCLLCNTVLVKQEIIPAEHKLKTASSLAATCTTTGLTEGKTCTICGFVAAKQEVTQALGHDCKNGNQCDRCKSTINFSNGMVYELNANGTEYTLVSIGSCTDKKIIIPEKYNGLPVTAIGDKAFYYKGSIVEIIIPNSVKSIGNSAFSECTSLSKIHIGTGVTSIGDNAFLHCKSLKSLVIPDAVEAFGFAPFADCPSLTEFIVTSNSKSFKTVEGDVYSLDGKTLVFHAPGKSTETINIPNTVTAIGDSAFYGCKNITAVTIHDKVTSIGSYAFSNCDKLQTLTLGNGIKTIGDAAFADCDEITKVVLPNSVTSIGEKAFYFCKSLTSVTVPAGATEIGDRAFTNCDSLTAIDVASGNTSYKSVNGDLYTKDGKTILAYAIGKEADSFVIPAGVTTIGDEAFSRSRNLKTITIPSGITKIGSYSFFYSGITAVVIPDTVTSIGDNAFTDCEMLNTVSIGSGIKEINTTIFLNCTAITSYQISESNKEFKSIDGNLYTKDGKTLLAYASGKTSDTFIIPEGVTTIRDNAFTTCYYLEKVTLPSSLTYIGSGAFKSCSLLEEVTFTKTSGWFVAADKDDANETSVDVSNIETNAKDIKGRLSDFIWKNK
ncbi:MAG: leucine-rich repeat domain-containing protein [Clostridia bacterium]|nr:leucine-rich repeat domain-containing protein [Clostridia bacterium]